MDINFAFQWRENMNNFEMQKHKTIKYLTAHEF